MEDWKLSQLKAHQQFTLGRIDGLRWVLERIDCLEDEDNLDGKQDIQDRIREHQGTDNELTRLIQKILDKRESVKQERLDGQAAVHEQFKAGAN